MRQGHADEERDKDTAESRRRISALREALREAAKAANETQNPQAIRTAQHAIDEAAKRVLATIEKRLRGFCQNRVAGMPILPGRAREEGGDLAQDAWLRGLRYLAGPRGDGIETEQQFLKFLYTTAQNRMLDLLDANAAYEAATPIALDAPDTLRNDGSSRIDHLPSPGGDLPEVLRFVGDETYMQLAADLFADEAAFRRAADAAGSRRHPRQFRALVLFELGEYLWRETQGDSFTAWNEIAALIRQFANAVLIPVALWEPIEMMIQTRRNADAETIMRNLREVVCETTGVNWQDGPTLRNQRAVLSYDLRRCAAAHAAKRSDKRKGDGETDAA